MKLVTFMLNTAAGRSERIGALIGDQVIDLNAGYALYLSQVEKEPKPYALAEVRIPPGMIGFLEGEEKSMQAARLTLDYVKIILERGNSRGLHGENLAHDVSQVKLLAPVPRPKTLVDFGAYEKHAKDAGGKTGLLHGDVWYKVPGYYKGNPGNVIGPDEDIYWPNYGEVKLDYECEIGIYIGKKGANIPREEASRYIAGYTIFNDISERMMCLNDIKLLGMAKGKDFDHGKIMGPCLVTPDEVDFKSLKATVRINGEFQGEAYAREMYWSWEQLITHLSRSMTLNPGDFLGSGTMGLCCGMSTGRMLQPGDVIELEINGIGVLRNKVVMPPVS
jgi:2-keto-4-pentenoate hydratase/2-oxohepta-3-ene-1,7-dioic acid hydratase in catechol pathway